MISQEKFVERVLDNFDRIHVKLDDQGLKINDLCNRMTTNENNFNAHLADREKRADKNIRNFYIVVAIVTVGFGLFEIFSRITV